MEHQDLHFPADTRGRLVEALVAAQGDNGNWCSVPSSRSDSASHLSPWTVAEALICLSTNNRVPKHLDKALEIVSTQSRVYSGNRPVGWSHHRLENEGCGTAITADCIIAMLLHGYLQEAMEALEHLIDFQQHDPEGNATGWGFTEQDAIPRVTPTCWAIRAATCAYAYVTDYQLRGKIGSSLLAATRWLVSIQDMQDGGSGNPEGGWGPTPDSESNSSTTALAVFVLLAALDLPCTRADRALLLFAAGSGVRSIRSATHIYTSGGHTFRYWEGNVENYGDRQFRGLGTPLVLAALLKAVETRVLSDVFISEIPDCLEFLTANETNGWVRTFGRPPTIFDNCYWLSALMYFQEYHLKNSRDLSSIVADLENRIQELESRPAQNERRLRSFLRTARISFGLFWLMTCATFAFLDLYLWSLPNITDAFKSTAISVEASVIIGLAAFFRFKIR